MTRRLAMILICGFVLGFGVSEAAVVELTANPNTEADWAGDRFYRAPGTCAAPGPFVIVGTVAPTTGGAQVLFRDGNVPNGLFCYYATAFDFAGNESVPSNLVPVSVDAQAPAPPVGLRVSVPEVDADPSEE